MAGLAEFTQQAIERKIGLGTADTQTSVSALPQKLNLWKKPPPLILLQAFKLN